MSIEVGRAVQRWIGLASVKPLPGNTALGIANRAFVPVVSDASSVADFLVIVEEQLLNIEFGLVSLDDVELLSARVGRQKLPEELLNAIDAIDEATPIAFGSFHAYSLASAQH